MFVLGHTGITLGIFYFIAKRFNVEPDFRYVIIGSMLPDAMDKFVSLLTVGDIFTNGRVFGHSLLFVLLLASLNGNFIWLAGGSLVHDMLDNFWAFPGTFFWPLMGNFASYSVPDISYWIDNILLQPYTVFGEIAGFLALMHILFRHKLYDKDNLAHFMGTGKLIL